MHQLGCPGCAHPGLQATQRIKAALAVRLPHTSQLTDMLICAAGEYSDDLAVNNSSDLAVNS
jgi:hypothetical protein